MLNNLNDYVIVSINNLLREKTNDAYAEKIQRKNYF